MKRCILVVEDDQYLAGLLQVTLELEYDVIICATGQAALFAIELTPPDLVILDLTLEGSEFSGLEVCAMIKTRPRFRHIPIIIISGDGSLDNQALARKMGAHAYLVKPFQPLRLLDILGEILG